ncbi:hypothetical protein BO78DRAFT_126204 [Aspergillus sclerotiicarbonarius CBS 121057]|uniref:Uncharacterized protein n=1 Tax=Aspergillus sclerotiicarbonarius (strain CBS 121057 / IBT 28362) TaxID=1448318 RepID=A0A319EQM7_ASPSB|nr:hypothetical protein BO78DRAFT_126204 [Aspergillus sclerotiicarbonarius CBS 121057]
MRRQRRSTWEKEEMHAFSSGARNMERRSEKGPPLISMNNTLFSYLASASCITTLTAQRLASQDPMTLNHDPLRQTEDNREIATSYGMICDGWLLNQRRTPGPTTHRYLQCDVCVRGNRSNYRLVPTRTNKLACRKADIREFGAVTVQSLWDMVVAYLAY